MKFGSAAGTSLSTEQSSAATDTVRIVLRNWPADNRLPVSDFWMAHVLPKQRKHKSYIERVQKKMGR